MRFIQFLKPRIHKKFYPMTVSRLILLGVVLFCGCSKEEVYNIVPVSGQVLLADKPLANVTIRFSPLRQTDSPNSGPSSYGKTDAEGRFELKTARVNSVPGAVAGPHRITFDSVYDEENDLDHSPVPDDYRLGIEYTVPKEGTDKAVIQLEKN
ncbi:DUF4198 domain-containing protein [Calycomorphotria hydatis]|uniref:Nickel uptake substrate-specific transmembrane region n=1 Tax=Calycomorphotria hydatis TaxID=2528027 RepID=A0A517T4Z6_9PLAN|nr:DUF4198 domain-containing protein [Calycomorphotria hydatis]QDT63447.1 hypothetical protein V22_06680 [Calycomorphotria hydatis]